MTQVERRKFYNALRKVRNKFFWKLTKDGRIRAMQGEKYFCPLTAIAKVETGKTTAMMRADVVTIPSLESVALDRAAIVIAADNSETDLYDWQLEEKNLRNTMLRIVGLDY